MKRRGRAAALTIAAPIGAAPVQPNYTGRLMHSTIMPELRGRNHLGIFLKIFRTWACSNRCDTALDSEVAVNKSGTPLVELERLHGNKLAAESFLTWEVLPKAIEKERAILEMVIDIGFPSETWCALKQIAAETQGAAHHRAKSEFESV